MLLAVGWRSCGRSGPIEADLGFHRALVAAVDSPRLGRVYQALSGEIHLSMVQSRRVGP